MSTVYERAQYEIDQIEKYLQELRDHIIPERQERLQELRIFLRMHDELWPQGGDLEASVLTNGPEPESEPETETERLAKQALAGHEGMRIRELYEEMVKIGYEPFGHKPQEVLRTRLLRRAHLFQNDGGVFSLRSEA